MAASGTNATGIRWALDDQQGTTRRLISSAGTDVADFNFDTFGRLAPGSANPAAVDYLLGFEGGEYDDEIDSYNGGTGLVRFDAVPADVYDTWRFNGSIQTFNDLHAPSGIITPEVRVMPPASGQMNNFLAPPG